MVTPAPYSSGACGDELVPVGQIARMLRELADTIQLAHLARCELVHLGVTSHASAVAWLIHLQRREISVEKKLLIDLKHVAYPSDNEMFEH